MINFHLFNTKSFGRLVLDWNRAAAVLYLKTEPYCPLFDGGVFGAYGMPGLPVTFNALEPLVRCGGSR